MVHASGDQISEEYDSNTVSDQVTVENMHEDNLRDGLSASDRKSIFGMGSMLSDGMDTPSIH
jgi:hypothetical protein